MKRKQDLKNTRVQKELKKSLSTLLDVSTGNNIMIANRFLNRYMSIYFLSVIDFTQILALNFHFYFTDELFRIFILEFI